MEPRQGRLELGDERVGDTDARAVELHQGVALFTANPASFYGLRNKGCVAPGADADLMILNRDLELVHLLARGRHAVDNGEVVLRGTFG